MTRPFLSRSLLKDRITFLVSFQSHWTGSDEQIGGTPWSCAVAQTDSACAKRLRQRSQTSISGRALSELFQIVVFVLPGGVHDTEDALDTIGGVEPGAYLVRAGVVIACDELAMTAFGKPFQAFISLVEVPIDDDHLFVEPIP